jgi:hypothetical protein
MGADRSGDVLATAVSEIGVLWGLWLRCCVRNPYVHADIERTREIFAPVR